MNHLLLEVGGSQVRLALATGELVSKPKLLRSPDVPSLSALLEAAVEEFRLSKPSRASIGVRIAGAGCLWGTRILSEHVCWLERETGELETEARRAAFASVRFYNDMVAAAAAAIEPMVTRLPAPAWPKHGRSCGVLGVGTGLGVAMIHPLPGRSFLVCGGELGFAPESAASPARLRDLVSGPVLRRALGVAADVPLGPLLDRAALNAPSAPAYAAAVVAFVRRLEWLVLSVVVAHKLERIVLTGGVPTLLRQAELVTEASLARRLAKPDVGNLDPLVEECAVAIETSDEVGVRGLAVIERRATAGDHGRVEAPLVLQF